jgi:hypothetical protein
VGVSRTLRRAVWEQAVSGPGVSKCDPTKRKQRQGSLKIKEAWLRIPSHFLIHLLSFDDNILTRFSCSISNLIQYFSTVNFRKDAVIVTLTFPLYCVLLSNTPDRLIRWPSEQVAGLGSTADMDSLEKRNNSCPGRELKHIPPSSSMQPTCKTYRLYNLFTNFCSYWTNTSQNPLANVSCRLQPHNHHRPNFIKVCPAVSEMKYIMRPQSYTLCAYCTLKNSISGSGLKRLHYEKPASVSLNGNVNRTQKEKSRLLGC